MSLHDELRMDRPCKSPDELHAWIRLHTGLSIPRVAVCPGHTAPFDYLCKSYFEPGQDLVVWAPRGGGKTRLAALATVLDLLHKPGCSVAILGGSLLQSLRMWEHLLPDLQRAGVLHRENRRRINLSNGASASVLTQSQRAVRGLRVQKLRCDETELFDPEIWQAAQLVTRSKTTGGQTIRGTIEALSTHHARGGLMGQIIDSAEQASRPVMRWCLLDVLEKCPTERECKSCPLWNECQGVAKTRCCGHVMIDDAIAMKARVSEQTWQSEMLCQRPSTSHSVFPMFDRAIHLREDELIGTGELSLAMDFGFHNPFVCLWIRQVGSQMQVFDEYVQEQRALAEHIIEVDSRPSGRVKRVCCDPAGNGRNDQTAESNIAFLRRQGFIVRNRASRIVDGLELIRAALKPATGEPTLRIHPRCIKLIKALEEYRYPDGGGELPIKDGVNDHPIDALRYFYVNQTVTPSVITRRY